MAFTAVCANPHTVFIPFTVRSNAGGQPDSAQQWQALLEGAQLGSAEPLGEWRPTGTIDGGGQYTGSDLAGEPSQFLPLPLSLTLSLFLVCVFLT